ncbi:ABC transporter substrate-binding protein [Gluconacetobacter johannae]|uniref:ABC transporter substrate-binding protein n=1 Tax=Gluconacetobacter johannae TaxID=112140 RepID=A0A7W4P4K2_9PROT|nr:ABC transporter substrate-binding protein [Gluconacetobacter johannae]MBB2177326.1 ABC transporter substrate-binding protein [Gluconacetobacter johannae]
MKKLLRLLAGLAIAPLLSIVLAGPARAEAPGSAPETVTIILDWFLNADHAALLAAEYSGAFRRHGLQVKLIAPADPGSPARLVAAGQADLAISYQTQLGMLAEQGIPLLRVGTLIDTPLDTLIAAPGIRSLADLKGRTIGISMAGVDDAVLATMLASVGLSLSDVRQVNVNFQLEQALMSHSVDAVIGATRTYELIDLQQKGVSPVAFYPEEHGVPLNDELIFVAARDHAHDARIVRFMAALEEGTNTLLNHPDTILAQAVHDHPELDTPLNRAAWAAILPRVCKQPSVLNGRRYRTFMAFLRERGVVRRDLALSAYAVDPADGTP